MMEHVHFIGIGGTGLSAIARVLLERGYRVSGSDQKNSSLAQAVERAGARVMLGHDAENVEGANIVIRSSAVPEDNVEVQAALQAGIPVLKRDEYLEQLMVDQVVVAVAGTHGKTTTSSMIAWILTVMGESPSFIIGGIVQNLGKNAAAGEGPVFVIEADEYDHMFLGLSPQIAVVTNVEHDHPDIFPTSKAFHQAFQNFTGRLKADGKLIFCAEDEGAAQLAQVMQGKREVISYGYYDTLCDYVAKRMRLNKDGGFTFDLYKSKSSGPIVSDLFLKVPGKHNVLNALAALAVVDQLNLSLLDASRALEDFKGSGRRFEIRGQYAGITLIDDYAHHPTEIQATLQAAREKYPERNLWVVWQPHTFSRTLLFFDRFADAFTVADQVIVTKVFPAREPVPPDFSAGEIVEAMNHHSAHFLPSLDEVINYLLEHLVAGDVLLVLTAGDAIQVNDQLAEQLGQK